MVFAAIVNETHDGPWESSGSVLPFGVFDSEEKAQELFDLEKKKKNSVYTDEDILVCYEVELNKPIKVTHENWQEKVLLSYWHCE
jgi:hypothetical protein